MPKTFRPAVLSANDLVEGHSVFLASEGWSPAIDHAIIAQTPEQAEELEALGTRFVDDNTVVGPYLVDVSLETGTPIPFLRREQIRASGQPTIPTGPAVDRRVAA